MIGIGLSLAIPRGSSSSVAPVRTAFLGNGGNNGTAQLNDHDLPFQTYAAAVAALVAAHPGETTTIKFLTDIENATVDLGNVDTLLAAGLTLASDDGTTRVFGIGSSATNISFGSGADAVLDLSNMALGVLVKTPHTGHASESAGTITATVASTIGELQLHAVGTVGVDGSAGSDGSNVTGNSGTGGVDGDPPVNGGDGEDVNATGFNGTDAAGGNTAWNCRLLGSLVVTNIVASASAGGVGGNGGTGANAQGGNGGDGGNSTSGSAQNGANGGQGGDAIANGGDGGDGGNGGNASTITRQNTVTVGGTTFAGGVGGDAGSGGAIGSASGGSGGLGGTGSNGGGSGANGAAGTATNLVGSNGTDGTDGSNGSVVVE